MGNLSEEDVDLLFETLVSDDKSRMKDNFSKEEVTYLLLNVMKNYGGNENSTSKKGEKFKKALNELSSLKPSNQLLMLMFEEDEGLRSAIIRAMAELNYTEAEELMEDSLESDDESSMLNSIAGLIKMGKKKKVSGKLRVLAEKSDKAFDSAVGALKAAKSRDAKKILVKLLEDNDPEVRRKAAESLVLFGGNETLNALSKKLDDKDAAVRFEALSSMAFHKPPTKPIYSLLNSKKAHIRWAALMLLLKVGNKNTARKVLPLLLDRYSHVRKAAQKVVDTHALPAIECNEYVWDSGKNIYETVNEYKRIKLLMNNDSVTNADAVQRAEIMYKVNSGKEGQEAETKPKKVKRPGKRARKA